MKPKLLTRLGAAAALIAAAGCHPQPSTQPAADDTAPGVQGGGATAVRSNPDLPPPPGVDPQELQPRRGPALTKALMPLEKVVAGLPRLAYLQTPTTQPATTSQPSGDQDVPLAAQHAYVQGRRAWKEQRDNYGAIRYLESALTIAPNNPAILRLLATIYIASDNTPRGASYLERAVASDPNDAESLFLLGRLAFDDKQWPKAIAIFVQARKLHLAEVDPGLVPLGQYYLASALEREGYDAAAIAQFQAFLEVPSHNNWSAQRIYELDKLSRQRGLVWEVVGDANNRLSQPAQAWASYQKAIELKGIEPTGLLVRQVYTLLQLGRNEDAEKLVIGRLSAAGADERSIELAGYLAQNGSHSRRVTERLEQVYVQSDKPTRLALAIAALQGPQQGQAFLRAHLAAKPADRQVFELLVKQRAAAGTTAADIAELMRIADTVMSAAPQAAEPYAAFLVDAVSDPKTLLEAFDKLSTEERARPMIRLMRGISLARADRLDEAAAELDKALVATPNLEAARLMLARLAVARGDYDRAEKLLEPLAQSKSTEVGELRIQILAQTKRTAQALDLLNQMIAQQPNNMDLVIEKAGLQLRQGDAVSAEQTLHEALNSHPEEERLYETLFNLYDSSQAPPDAQRQYGRLMMRLASVMPNSRIARLKRAELADAGNDFALAEKLLRGLLSENAKDYRALEQLLEVLWRSGRKTEADSLLADRMAHAPDDRGLLATAKAFYLHKDRRHFMDVLEKEALLLPEGTARDVNLASIYLQSNQPKKALDILDRALAGAPKDPKDLIDLLATALTRTGHNAQQIDARFKELLQRMPAVEAELLYSWAMAYESLGQKPRSEQILRDNIKKHPDHAASNNALGYALADRGQELEEARKMVQAAINAEPQRSEYLDSMGWVYYKLGQFDEAVTWLQRARAESLPPHPVILDHLGDALYRVGKAEEAVRTWQQAQEALTKRHQDPDQPEDDPAEAKELKALERALPDKVEAVTTNRKPAVAPSPNAPAPAGDAPAAKGPPLPKPVEAP